MSNEDIRPCGRSDCNTINQGIDKCLLPLIRALNAVGLRTVASCCGHGNRPGRISLKDGREILILPDFDTAQRIDQLFPDIHGDKVKRIPAFEWHAVYSDPLINQKVASLGAMLYILNEDDKPITRGHHSFWMHKGTLMGNIGAKEENVIYCPPTDKESNNDE